MSAAMPRPFSVYLDLVRFTAACLVYLWHANQRWLVEPVLPMSGYGHSAVVVFFVLSGYVIAYITATKERDWATYAASRLSRTEGWSDITITASKNASTGARNPASRLSTPT